MTFEPDAIRAVLERPGVLEDISSAYDSPASTVDDWVSVIERQQWLERSGGRRPTPGPARSSPTTSRDPSTSWSAGSLTAQRPDTSSDAILARRDLPDPRPGACLSGGRSGVAAAARPSEPRLRAEPRAVADIPPATWDGLAGAHAVGDPVLVVGVPSRVVGRVCGERPRGDARRRRRPTRRPMARPTPSRSSRSCTGTRSSRATPLTHTTMRHGADAELTAGRPRRDGDLLRGLVSRRLRDDPLRARGPAGGGRCRRDLPRGRIARAPGTRSTFAGCAAATPPPRRWRRPSVRARWPRAGRSTSSARTSARS